MVISSGPVGVLAELSRNLGIPANFFGRWGVFDGVHPRGRRARIPPSDDGGLDSGPRFCEGKRVREA